MKKWTKINSDDIEGFVCDDTYTSKLLTGDELTNEPVININEGTLKPFCRTAGGVHEETEIYYMVSVGKGTFVVLDDEPTPVKNGDIIVIPGGVHHWIDNTKCPEPFVLFTFWPTEKQNGVYFERVKAWGKSFRFKKDSK